MSERFQISKLNENNTNFTTINENVAANGHDTKPNGNAYEQHPNNQVPQNNPQGGRKSSRLSIRGFGNFLKTKNSEANDRKFSLAQLTQ